MTKKTGEIVERPEVEIMKREAPPGLRLVCARLGDRFRLERKGSSTLDRDEMPKGGSVVNGALRTRFADRDANLLAPFEYL